MAQANRSLNSAINQDYDYGYAMVRPDGLSLGLDNYIVERIEASGLEIAARKISVVTGDQVDALYPDLHEKPYYPSMKTGMVGRRIMSLLIAGHVVAEQLGKIKGSALDVSSSVRGDFSGGHLLPLKLHKRFFEQCLTEDDLKTPEIKLVKQDDRLHTDVTNREAANSIRVMFSSAEIAEISKRYPGVPSFISLNLLDNE